MIHLYTFSYNEEVLLPYFLRHYRRFVDRIVILDNGSTDRTRELARADPRVEVRDWDTGGVSDELSLANRKNHCWKESRGVADWVIVCDFDEFLYHESILPYLDSLKKAGVKVPKVTGWQMVSEQGPTGDGQIYDRIFLGAPDLTWESKHIVFDPSIQDIHYSVGAHVASPTEPVHPSDLKLLHFRFIGVDYEYARCQRMQGRLHPDVETHQWPTYRRTREEIARMIDDVRRQSQRVVFDAGVSPKS